MREEYTRKLTCLGHKLRMLQSRTYTDPNLTSVEFVVLVAIAERAKHREDGTQMSASTSDVAKYMGSTLPAASKMIRNLSMKGYVRQVPSIYDRRVTQLALTDKGNEILKQTFQERKVIMKQVFEKFGEDKVELIIDLLSELVDIIDEEVEKQDD